MPNVSTVLWAVVSDALTDDAIQVFEEHGLVIRQINTAQLSSTSLIDVDVAVVEVCES